MVPFKLRRSLLLRKGFVRFRSKRQAFDTGSVGYAWKRERGPSPNSILNSELFSSLSGCFTVSHIHYQHLSDNSAQQWLCEWQWEYRKSFSRCLKFNGRLGYTFSCFVQITRDKTGISWIFACAVVLSTRKKTPSVVTQMAIIKRFAIKQFAFSSFGRYFKVLTVEVASILLAKIFLRWKSVFCFIFCSNFKLGGKLRRITRKFLGQGCFFGIRALW